MKMVKYLNVLVIINKIGGMMTKKLKHLKWYTWLQFYYDTDIHGPKAKEKIFKILKKEIDRQVVPNGFNEVEIWINCEHLRKDPDLIKRGLGREEFKSLYYPSKVCPEYSVVGEDEDVLPDVIDYCHSKGLKVMLYYTIKNNDDFVKEMGKELLQRYPLVNGLAVEGLEDEVLISTAEEFKKIKPDVMLHAYTSHGTPVPPPWEVWDMTNHQPENHNKVLGPNTWLYVTAAACDLEKEKFHTPESFGELVERVLYDPEIEGMGLFVHTPKCDTKPYADKIGECMRKHGGPVGR